MLEKLGLGIRGTLKKLAKSLFVDQKLIDELIKDIQRALLASDVNVQLVFDLSKSIKERAKEEDAKGLTKKEQLINIVYEELTTFLGGEGTELKIPESKPFKILLVGLYGSGKTTASGKLAKYFTKRGKTVSIVGLDTMRPAAMDQISQLVKGTSVKAIVDRDNKDPVAIYKNAEATISKQDVAIIDTAGRDALSDDLIEEISKIKEAVDPDEIILVMSADIGQTAKKQADSFHDNCGVTGVIITKMDGTARGGGALSACAATEAPVLFLGVGEKIDDLEKFDGKRFVGRLLGMGDLASLVEKAQGAVTEEDAKVMENRLLKGEFNLLDLYNQMEAMNKMGTLGNLMEMIPGMGQLKLPKDAINVQEGKLVQWKRAMDSMTKKELEEPDVIDSNRVKRIATGSGVKQDDIRGLIKQYKQSKKMVKLLKGDVNPDKLLKKLKHQYKG